VSDRRYERRPAARPPRKRSPIYSSSSGTRPDRVAAWAFALGIFLILVAATTSHGQSGGAGVVSPPGAHGPADGLSEAQLGQRILRIGSSGDDVRTLQLILGARGYGAFDATGTFGPATDAAVRAFQRDVGAAVDGVVGPQTRPELVRLMSLRRATWYGPGLYGNKTACGARLTPATLGVAHRSLPCGTRVTFYHGGRFVTVTVIDRGPFRHGVSWDLTAATAQRIGMTQSSRVRSLSLH
jgi:hypothetical protein